MWNLALVQGVRSSACDEYVSLSVRISQKPRGRTSPNFLHMLPIDVAPSSSNGLYSDTLCTSCFVDDVLFSHNGPYEHHAYFYVATALTTGTTAFDYHQILLNNKDQQEHNRAFMRVTFLPVCFHCLVTLCQHL